MKHNKKITPLSQWPTEALIEMYRRHRFCFEHVWCRTKCRWKNDKPTYWEPTYGEFVDEYCLLGKKKNEVYKLPIYYTKVDNYIWQHSTHIEGNKCHNSYTDRCYQNGIAFSFEGMYWEGELNDLKKELANRPHIGMKGRKEFRKWKMNYKHNK